LTDNEVFDLQKNLPKRSFVELGRSILKRALFRACSSDVRRYFALRARVSRLLATLNAYERENVLFMESIVRPGSQAIDVGANFGVYTRRMSRALGPTGHVWAFEPLSLVYEALVDNCRGLPNVTCLRKAVGSVTETRTIHIPMLYGIPEPALATVENIDPSVVSTAEEIEIAALDDFEERFADVSFVKVDTEGHELAFFEGARKVLGKFRPVVQFECHDMATLHPAYVKIAEEHGYEICFLQKGEPKPISPGSLGKAAYDNYYLIRKERFTSGAQGAV
jgi:FkbM family methyltransferase